MNDFNQSFKERETERDLHTNDVNQKYVRVF